MTASEDKIAWQGFIYSLAAAACYLLPTFHSSLLFTLPLYYFFLFKIISTSSAKSTFFLSLLTGFIISAIHLRFFFNIFSTAAIPLWAIIASWTAISAMTSYFFYKHLRPYQWALAIPLIFFVMEYIQCEVYPLKFTWSSAGYLFFSSPLKVLFGHLGIYGISLLIFTLVLLSTLHKSRHYLLGGICTFIFIFSFNISAKPSSEGPIVTGIQMEFPDESVVFRELDKALKKIPDTDIFLLSEYTFGNIPDEALLWCKTNRKYIVVGAKITLDDSFKNTAVVINPQGAIEHRQVKAVPIQFFNDGIPAQKQTLWHSPWGKIGLCICYDLSYTTVIDKLVKLDAQALLVPTMDVISWGENQHQLHSRVAPIRAAEYNIPIFKTASSGISQSINAQGDVIAHTSYPGQFELISTRLSMSHKGSIPLDRYFFIPSLVILILTIIFLFIKVRKKNINL